MRPDIDLRAALDTRGAAILLPLSLLAVIGFAALGGLLQPALTPDATSDLESTVFVLTLPLSLIIPVLTVWITAGEWSDRSIQTTLLQRPGRLGVLASKCLATLTATFLFSLAMGVALQSTVLGLVAAIGVPFVVGTAGTLATAFGSETLADVIRAVDLSSAAVALADGSAGAFELLPLLLLVAVPVVLGAQRWRHREIG